MAFPFPLFFHPGYRGVYLQVVCIGSTHAYKSNFSDAALQFSERQQVHCPLQNVTKRKRCAQVSHLSCSLLKINVQKVIIFHKQDNHR